jgi:hypothetical protein
MRNTRTQNQTAAEWLQVFELRVPLADAKWVEATLSRLGREKVECRVALVTAYRHTEVCTDFSVHVLYGNAVPDQIRTEVGHQLLASLEEIGTSYTSTWQRITREDVSCKH